MSMVYPLAEVSEEQKAWFLTNCDRGVRMFGDVAEKLKKYSDTYSELFFLPPLTCGKQMFEIVVKMRKELEKEDPNFNLLNRLNGYLHMKQVKHYRAMGVVADAILIPHDGFKLSALTNIFKFWMKVVERGSRLNNQQGFTVTGCPLAHEEFMEVFKIDIIDILRPMPLNNWMPVIRNDSEYVPVSPVSSVDDDEDYRDSRMIGMADDYHLYHERSISRASTESSEGEEEDNFYVRIQEGKFLDFEIEWKKLMESGTIALSLWDTGDEPRGVLLADNYSDFEAAWINGRFQWDDDNN